MAEYGTKIADIVRDKDNISQFMWDMYLGYFVWDFPVTIVVSGVLGVTFVPYQGGNGYLDIPMSILPH
jgi:hypothetical protein